MISGGVVGSRFSYYKSPCCTEGASSLVCSKLTSSRLKHSSLYCAGKKGSLAQALPFGPNLLWHPAKSVWCHIVRCGQSTMAVVAVDSVEKSLEAMSLDAFHDWKPETNAFGDSFRNYEDSKR